MEGAGRTSDAVVIGYTELSIEAEVKIEPTGTSGSRMSPETHIRAHASKLWDASERERERASVEDVPEENKERKDDIVLP